VDEVTSNQVHRPVPQPGDRAGVAKIVIYAVACTVLNESLGGSPDKRGAQARGKWRDK